MVSCGDWPVGLCSWSLQTDIAGVAEAMAKMGLEHVHLAVRPGLGPQGKDYIAEVKKQKWIISSTMIDFPQEDYSSPETIRQTGGVRPDKFWPCNRKLFLDAVKLTAELNVPYISMHAGFIDVDDRASLSKFCDRIGTLADAAAESAVILLLETGQESAEHLRFFLQMLNHPAVCINFDPANVILYDNGDPIEALKILIPWIRHIHIKDAIRPQKKGCWGTEVPWGHGQVAANKFLATLKQVGFEGVLALERESGTDRCGDIARAVEALKHFEQPSKKDKD